VELVGEHESDCDELSDCVRLRRERLAFVIRVSLCDSVCEKDSEGETDGVPWLRVTLELRGDDGERLPPDAERDNDPESVKESLSLSCLVADARETLGERVDVKLSVDDCDTELVRDSSAPDVLGVGERLDFVCDMRDAVVLTDGVLDTLHVMVKSRVSEKELLLDGVRESDLVMDTLPKRDEDFVGDTSCVPLFREMDVVAVDVRETSLVRDGVSDTETDTLRVNVGPLRLPRVTECVLLKDSELLKDAESVFVLLRLAPTIDSLAEDEAVSEVLALRAIVSEMEWDALCESVRLRMTPENETVADPGERLTLGVGDTDADGDGDPVCEPGDLLWEKLTSDDDDREMEAEWLALAGSFEPVRLGLGEDEVDAVTSRVMVPLEVVGELL